jgi:hypothetical protein
LWSCSGFPSSSSTNNMLLATEESVLVAPSSPPRTAESWPRRGAHHGSAAPGHAPPGSFCSSLATLGRHARSPASCPMSGNPLKEYPLRISRHHWGNSSVGGSRPLHSSKEASQSEAIIYGNISC